MFSKRHYEYLARALLHAAANSLMLSLHAERRAGIRDFAFFLANSFEHDEPNFNRTRFLAACGVDKPEPNPFSSAGNGAL